MIKIEVCAGSIEDCIIAQKNGATQIELNSGLFMGGLTPSLATVKLAKEKVSLPIYPMLRPRGGGFSYSDLEVESMKIDAHLFAKEGVEGLVFGFLNDDRTINTKYTKEFVDICHEYKIDAIFHRAFDNVKDPYLAIETLIDLGVTRILTSGLASSADLGIELLKELQAKYGDKIELLVGAGVNESNVIDILENTGVKQVHSSFKTWKEDKTTSGEQVTYKYSDAGSYDVVSEDILKSFVEKVKTYQD